MDANKSGKYILHYNTVNFYPNPHNRHPTGELLGVFREFKVWFMLCRFHYSVVSYIIIYWTVL